MADHDGRTYAKSAPDPNGPGYTYTGPVAKQDEGKTPEQIEQQVRQQQAQVTPGQTAGSGGGYRCTVGELRGAIKQVDAMLTVAQQDVSHVQALLNAQPAAKDAEGSVMFASGLQGRGTGVQQLIHDQINDLSAYKSHLEAVASNYENADDSVHASFADIQRKM